MKVYIHNTAFPGYDNDIRALVLSFYPGAMPVFDADASANCASNCRGVPVTAVSAAGMTAPYTCAVSDTAALKASEASAVAVYAENDAANCGIRFRDEDIYLDIDAIAPGIERDEVRFNEKTNLKRALYMLLSEASGKELPWGTLTGIRPVRIREMLDEAGRSREETDRELKERFLISDSKLSLMNEIADREKKLLGSIDYQNGCSIYIGIPFCPTRCIYCSFASNQLGADDDRPDRYVTAVCRELEALCAGRKDTDSVHFDRSRLQTIYIGGGTPTALNERQLERLLDKVEELFGIPAEYTVEAGRPDSINADKLDILKAHGVGRISVNPQSFNQRTLDLIGRRHTVQDTVAAYELARAKGFDNINMDIIMGLPGEKLDDVRHTLKVIGDLKPDSLTVHALAVKRASRLSEEGKAWGGIARICSSPDSSEADELARMTELGEQCARSLGMHPYYLYRQKNMAGNQDNTGYAREGSECLYNILMMEEKHSVYGIGAGASTKLVFREKNDNQTDVFKKRIIRSDNVKNLNDYLVYTF